MSVEKVHLRRELCVRCYLVMVAVRCGYVGTGTQVLYYIENEQGPTVGTHVNPAVSTFQVCFLLLPSQLAASAARRACA